MDKRHKTAISYLVATIRRMPNLEKLLSEPEILARWAGFEEWIESSMKTRFYFNDPEAPNEKMYGYRNWKNWVWVGGYEGSKKKIFKELNKKNLEKMQAALDAARVELTAFVEAHRNELPIFGEGVTGEIRSLKEFPELGEYVLLDNGKWERRD